MILLASLGALAAIAVWGSAMPPLPAAFLAVGVAFHGWRLARREASRPACEMWLRPADASLRLNFPDGSQSWSGVSIRLRGPMARIGGRDRNGRYRCLLWWPDTLSRRDRRRLRLAAGRLERQSQASPSFIF